MRHPPRSQSLLTLQLMILWCALMVALPQTSWGQTAPLRLAVERDYAPFIFEDAGGQVRGLSMEMLSLVQSRSGLLTEPMPAQPLAKLLEDLREQRADMITSLRSTPERNRFLVFSRPYIEVPAILVLGASASATQQHKGLGGMTGKRIAVGRGYGVEAPMRQRYPAIDWQAVDNDAMALRGVSEGRYEGAVADVASVAYLIRRDGFMNLQPAGRVGYDYPLSFALTPPHAHLLPVIDRAIQEIPAKERQAVIERWMGGLDMEPLDQHPRWLIWTGSLLLLIGVAGSLLWWHRGRRQLRSADEPEDTGA